MDREILFRGIGTEKFCKGSNGLFPKGQVFTGHYFSDLCNGEIKHFIKDGEIIAEVYEDSVAEYTGHTYRGVQIFENDLIRFYQAHKNFSTKVIFANCGFGLCGYPLEGCSEGVFSLDILEGSTSVYINNNLIL